MRSKNSNLVFCVILCAITIAATSARAQEPAQQPQPKIHIDWQDGPTTGKLGDIAEIEIPQGYRFAGKVGAEKVLQLTQNLPSGRELGVIIAEGSGWFMIFEFEDSGYVKDDEKLDSDAILKSMQKGTERANGERSKRGWKPIHVTGWQREPFYDPQTHNLTWASLVKGDSAGTDDSAVNHSVRILGRRGTMNVDLVASTEEYLAVSGKFNDLMGGFHFTDGNRYSDFTKGDKVAEYGLTALIVGGGAAVALKTGLLAKLWKFIVVGILAIVAAIKKFLRAIFGKEERIEDPNQQAAPQGQ
jgi:uncharacterized membrane-anchored protein